MAEHGAKDCSICSLEFDEDERCPRSLPCIHCFCTHCIQQLILKNDKKCPFCRQLFEAGEVQDLKINYTTLDLLQYVKNLESQIPRAQAKSRSELIAEMKQSSIESNNQNLATSKEAVSKLKTTIENNMKLKMDITQRLTKVRTKLRDLEENYAIKMHYIEDENQRLENQLTEAEEQLQQFNKVKMLLSDAKTFQMVDSAVNEAEATDEAFKTWFHKVEISISTLTKITTGIERSMINTEEQLRNFIKNQASPEDEVDIVGEIAAMLLKEENRIQITPEILQRMSAESKWLLKVGVYAVKQHEGNKKCAKISVSENKVCMHALTDEQVPPNVYTIEHEVTMNLVNSLCRLCFLEFGEDKSVLGRVYVRLCPDTKRAQNFSVLCTGEKGPSFLQTPILGLREKPELDILDCGSYWLNNNRVIRAIIPGCGEEEGGVLRRAVSVGTVYGWGNKRDGTEGNVDPEEHASGFSIITKCKKTFHYSTVFGKVESGLHILEELKSAGLNIKKIRIRDCGIVLSQ